MKHKQKTGELSKQKEASNEKWYGYYTEKTMPKLLKENHGNPLNAGIRAEVNLFFHEHGHHQILFVSNKKSEKIWQYYCKICGFTYGLCSLHAIRLHCMSEHPRGKIVS